MKIKVSTRFLILAVFLAISSIYTTYYGFFKMTIKLENISTTNLLEDNGSWFPRRKKLIFLVIDALRFDYLPTDVTMNNVADYKEVFHGQMQKLRSKMLDQPKNFQILKVSADPPTWTVNRIPSMNTGNIPPPANILQFAGPSPLNEDNFVKQAHRAGLKSYFVGDPVWMQYSPDEFARAIDVHPFDIMDFTVDDTTIKTMKEWVKEDNFDFILSHCLGLDHAGHALGIFNPEVPKQIRKMDEFVADLIDLIDDDTMLFVTGDHGMTANGAHGRDSEEEKITTLVAYSKKGFQKEHETDLNSIMKSIRDTEKPVMQVDLTSTVAMMLGLPIPYSNLGTIINDIYPIEENQKDAGVGTQDCAGNGNLFLNRLVRDNYLNSLQLKEYFDNYNHVTKSFPKHLVQDIKKTINSIKEGYETFMGMQTNHRECKANYRDIGKQVILDVKTLSEAIHGFTLNHNTYDLSIIIQSMITLLFLAILYIFVIQYDHKSISLDNYSFRQLRPIVLRKPIVFPLLLSALIGSLWVMKQRFVYPLAAVTLSIAIYAVIEVGYLIAKRRLCNDEKNLLSTSTSSSARTMASTPINNNKKLIEDENQVDQNDLDDQVNIEIGHAATKDDIIEDNVLVKAENDSDYALNFKNLPILSRPMNVKFILGVVAVVTGCLIMTQSSMLEDNTSEMFTARVQYYLLALAALRAFVFDRVNKTNLAVLIASGVFLLSTHAGYELLTAKIAMSFIILLDYLYHERNYIHREWANKSVKKTYLFDLSIICAHAAVLGYHLAHGNQSEERTILVPRIAWAFMFLIGFLAFAFRMPANARKASLQLAFVLLLTILQHSEHIANVVFIVYLFKTITDFWVKKCSAFNYMYVMLIAAISHIGLFLTHHTDRRIPIDFKLGFVGLHDFNPVVSVLFIILNYLTALLIGTMFVSYYSRRLGQYESDDKVVKSEVESEAIESEVRLVQRSNAILLVFFFNVVYFGAVIKCITWRDWDLVEAIEKFLVDSFMYVFMMLVSFIMF